MKSAFTSKKIELNGAKVLGDLENCYNSVANIDVMIYYLNPILDVLSNPNVLKVTDSANLGKMLNKIEVIHMQSVIITKDLKRINVRMKALLRGRRAKTKK